MLRVFSRYVFLLVFCGLLGTKSAKAFAILAHEAIIDASWEKEIKPLLRERYPNSTDSLIKLAHSYAYGGAMVADMGYIPTGNAYFSDLLHYVRSGDMVQALLSESENLNQYAFALGALSHYFADEYGHSRATNLTVPNIYKNLGKKYGTFVTYGDDPVSHSRVEFSFDVLQIARGNYNSQAYHQFIGFNIDTVVLKKAFMKTYGEDLNEVCGNIGLTIKTFRWAVKNLFPTLVRKTWKAEKDTILKRNPTMTAKQFKYKMNKREYYQEYGKDRSKPGFWANFTAFIIRTLPKVGPLKTLKYVDPGQKGENLFVKSFDTILVKFADNLHLLHDHKLELKDIDFDTGRKTNIGEYALADQTYANLLISLYEAKFKTLTPNLKNHLLGFYKDPQNIPASKRYPIKCDEVEKALAELRTADTVADQWKAVEEKGK